jgi:hypothetical protein
MGYQLRLEGTTVVAVPYIPCSKNRSSNGMKAWMARQKEFDKHAVELPGITFVQWLNLLKKKYIYVKEI